MSRRINTTLSSPEALKIAESALRYYSDVAFSNDVEVAFYNSPVYKSANKALLAAIKLAYPHMDAKRIYLVWVDCNESIRECVAHIRSQNRYPI